MDTVKLQQNRQIIDFTDNELLSALSGLSIEENRITVEILLYLAEVDKRSLYLGQGFSSLFAYCVQGPLRYSEGAAQRRIASARLVVKYPELVPLLLSKELSISTLSLIAGILNDENKSEVIDAVKGKSRRGVDLYLAYFKPQKVLREVIKPIVIAKSAKKQRPPLFKKTAALEPAQSSTKITAAGESEDKALGSQDEIFEKRYQLKFSVNASVQENLEKAKSLLSGKYPSGVKLEDVLAEALEVLLEKRSPERRATRRAKRQAKKITSDRDTTRKVKEAKQSQAPVSRHVPQAIRDQVYLRDGGSCSFLSEAGRRCGARHDLEVHHINPFARQGEHLLENLTLRCRCHNIYQAEIDYGKKFMSRKVYE